MGRSRKSKVSTPMINETLPELLRLIIARLPIKILLKFRSVCKTWRTLIDSPDFMALHLILFPNNLTNTFVLSLQYNHHTTNAIDIAITLRKTNTFRKLTNFTPQGFLLSSSYGLYLFSHNHYYFLWNPSLKKSIILPNSPFISDPHHTFLLGFSFTTNDYKLVDFRHVHGYRILMVVFSLRNYSWMSEIQRVYLPSQCGDSGFLTLLSDDQFVPIQGVSYWLHNNNRNSNSNGVDYLAWFNFDLEEFSFMDLPDASCNVITRFIFNLGSSLAVFIMCSTNISIWVLDKGLQGRNWRLWFSGNSSPGSCSLLKDCTFSSSRTFYEQESYTFLIETLPKVVSYNIHTHEVLGLRVRAEADKRCIKLRSIIEERNEKIIIRTGHII